VPSRRLLGLLAVAVPASIAAAVLLPHSPAGLRELLLGLGPVAPAIAIAAWIVLTPAMFPGTVLAAAGGLAFGVPGGAALAFAGALAGGLTAFVVARTAAHGPVDRFVRRSRRFARVHALVERRGFAAVLAARLMPGVPACGLHYVAGVSPVSARAFALAMAIGALVRTVPFALLGGSLASGSLAPVLVAASSIVIGAAVAAALVRQIRRPAATAAS
jgi:uncharacterized membrane protein YdjX (TVP38/TMEM64 family)